MTFSERLLEIRTGFERPFWVANISELFERLSYYAAFASLARYLHETLGFRVKQASSLTGLFGGLVWFLAVFGGTIADRLGFRRSLSLAYLILSCSYFLLGSIGSPWLAPVRNAMPLGVLVTLVLMLPALGVSLVKPCVVGTTARASKENVRSIGYSIYYTLVNIGGAAGPYIASWVHEHMRVENVFRVAALSVFAMFFAVLLLFKEPRRSGDTPTVSLAQSAKNFGDCRLQPAFHAFSGDLLRILGGLLAGIHHSAAVHSRLHRSQGKYRTAFGNRAAHRDRAAIGCQFSHATNARFSCHHSGDTDLGTGVGNLDCASYRSNGCGDVVYGLAR